MLAKVRSMGLHGIEAYPVEVEVYVTRSEMPRATLVGLPDASVKESIDRVRAALRNSGYRLPTISATVNLAPADRRKEGPAFELPIALGLIQATDSATFDGRARYAVVGELALDGRVRKVNGCLSMALEARAQKLDGVIVPIDNAREAAVVAGIDVIPVGSLAEAVAFLTGAAPLRPVRLDLEEVFRSARRLRHRLQRGAGPAPRQARPGGGRGRRAQRPDDRPARLRQEHDGPPPLHASCPASRWRNRWRPRWSTAPAGSSRPGTSLMAVRPFRAPHHTVSTAGLVGGGTNPRPGEISLAHHGVLFLDELPEFTRSALETLRQPIEDGRVTIARAQTTVTYPAGFMLVAAMNPCPCGHYTDPRRECRCSPRQIETYRRRISGPLLDRIDIHVDVPRVEYRDMTSSRPAEPSEAIRARVEDARRRQLERFRGARTYTNARMSTRQVREHCKVDSDGQVLLRQAMDVLGFSARAYTKILKVARTIADLEGAEAIAPHHVSEAINYRALDRKLE